MKKSLHVIVWKEGKLFVAKLLEIELASQGKTQKEALQNLQEAFELYMEDENMSNISFPSIENVTTQTFPIR